MCGICGFTGDASEELLNTMNNAIYHRGPDEGGTYIDESVSLASRRLSIVDIKDGTQPIQNETGDIILVWNGEIYNYKELRESLIGLGHHFLTSHSDTEVLLRMYEEYGSAFVNHLNGMFAIAIYDKRTATILLIRDRMGVKPLFYSFNGTTLIFSSELKSILLHPSYKKEVNYYALYQYLSFKHVPAPDTAFNGIHSLTPGTILLFQQNTQKEIPYWHTDFKRTSKDSYEAAVEKIRDLLQDSIAIRLRADVEVGAFLSGGLDSSLVTALASKFTPKLKTFSLGHDVKVEQESHKEEDVRCADQMARLLGTEHSLHTLHPHDVIDELDRILCAFDQPFAGSISTFFLTQVMSRHVKTALSGDGADELFGGYLPHLLAKPMSYLTQTLSANEPIDNYDQLKPFEDNLPYLKAMYQFSQGREELLAYRMCVMTDAEKKLLLNAEIFGDFLEQNATFQSIATQYTNLTATTVLNRSLEYDWNNLLPNQVLAYSDFLSMANSLEVRSPFLDYRLVEYVQSLPDSYKIRNGESKSLLKAAANGILPENIISRPKEGFVMPVNDWLKSELKEYVTDTLSSESIHRYQMFQPESVYFILRKYYQNPIQNQSLEPWIWNLVTLQKWCGQYL